MAAVNDARTVAGRNLRPFAAGPVAQWLEPAAHNGLVAGSSPAGPTNEIKYLAEQPFLWRTVSRTGCPIAVVKASALIIRLAFSTTAPAEAPRKIGQKERLQASVTIRSTLAE